MRIRTLFKKILTNNTKSDILTKKLVLLHVDWDKNGLLFTKRLHIINKTIGYSLQEPISTVFYFVVHIKQVSIYNSRIVEPQTESA